MPARHRGDLLEGGRDRRAEVEARASERQLGPVGSDAREDPVDELIEPLDLRGRFGHRHLRRAVLLAEKVEVPADHRERRAQVVGHHRDEVRARALELAQALGRLQLERVQRRLVDRERGLVRERADEAHLFVEKLGVVRDLEHDRAEEPLVRDERHGDVVERDDRPALGDRAARRERRGLPELARAGALDGGIAFVVQQDRAGRTGVDADEPVHDEREHLVEVERRGQHVGDLEQRGHLAQLALRLALQAPLLDDPRHLVRDRLQEVDLLATEVPRLDGLHVHDAGDLVADDDRH